MTQSPGQQLIGIARSIGRGFANLLNFHGRDGVALFWPYAFAIVVIVSFGTALALDAPMRATMQVMFDYVSAHPDQGSVMFGTNGASVRVRGFPPELAGQLWSIIVPTAGMVLAAVVLLSAAVVRRLRDGNRSFVWGLVPALFAVLAFVLFPLLFDPSQASGWVFFLLLANNVLYIGFLIRLIVLLAGPSAPSPEVSS